MHLSVTIWTPSWNTSIRANNLLVSLAAADNRAYDQGTPPFLGAKQGPGISRMVANHVSGSPGLLFPREFSSVFHNNLPWSGRRVRPCRGRGGHRGRDDQGMERPHITRCNNQDCFKRA